MPPILLTLTVVVAFASPVVVPAQDARMVLTGTEFLSACSRPDPEGIGFCHGYAQAVFDVAQQNEKTLCAPPGLTRATIVGAVVERLSAVEELRAISAWAVVYGSLLSMFPCR